MFIVKNVVLVTLILVGFWTIMWIGCAVDTVCSAVNNL